MIEDLVGKTVADKYRVDSRLSETSLGDLYRGWSLLMEKLVTVKILAPALAIDQRLVDRFLAEAKNAARVTHENLLNVTDFGTDGKGITYSVFEGVDGETLRSLIDRDETLPLSLALNVAEDTAKGLAAAHEKGVIHRALSPDKILVAPEAETPIVKVFDLDSEPVGRASNRNIEYLAPEQYADASAGDERSDIYALGVVLYQMLAGTLPFTGTTAGELTQKQESEPPAPLSAFRSDLPKDLEPMILTAMSIDPDRRYQSMQAFAEDLGILSASVRGIPKVAAAATQPKRNIWQTAFIVLAGISILAVALIFATSGKKTDPTAQLQAEPGSFPVQPIGPATGAQEESLVKLPAMTDAEIMATANMEQPPGTLPGGDGYNAWANGGAPPPGAPPMQIPPGGQYYTIDPNTGSPFMPPEGGVVLVPVPANTNTAVKPSPTPRSANTGAKPSPSPDATPKPMATPPKTDKPASGQPNKPASGPAGKAGKPGTSE